VKLLEEYKRLAATGLWFRGTALKQHSADIKALIDKTESTTLLDWGCGAGMAYKSPSKIHKKWGVPKPTLYDPSFPEHDKRPEGTFHGVLCTDVLEHLPEGEVDALIKDLFDHAERFVFASVCCRPAGKVFSDGTNMHVTVKPYDWWYERFNHYGNESDADWRLKETP
jgi:hypothetical protein